MITSIGNLTLVIVGVTMVLHGFFTTLFGVWSNEEVVGYLFITLGRLEQLHEKVDEAL